MRVLQWNMGVHEEGKDKRVDDRVCKLLENLVGEHRPDIVGLQEAPVGSVRRVLRGKGFDCRDNGNHRIVSAYRPTEWFSVTQVTISFARALALLLKSSTADMEMLFCNLHLPSRLHKQPNAISVDLSMFLDEIKFYRRNAKDADVSELILGDFNLNPYHQAITSKADLYSNRSLRYVRYHEQNRAIGEPRRPLFNLSWRLFAADTEPYGTYYSTGDSVDEPWYVFDQLVASADLVDGSIDVQPITRVKGKSLLSTGVGKPDRKVGSDHLPLLWTLSPSKKLTGLHS